MTPLYINCKIVRRGASVKIHSHLPTTGPFAVLLANALLAPPSRVPEAYDALAEALVLYSVERGEVIADGDERYDAQDCLEETIFVVSNVQEITETQEEQWMANSMSECSYSDIGNYMGQLYVYALAKIQKQDAPAGPRLFLDGAIEQPTTALTRHVEECCLLTIWEPRGSTRSETGWELDSIDLVGEAEIVLKK